MQIGEDGALSKGSGVLVVKIFECFKEKSEIRIFKKVVCSLRRVFCFLTRQGCSPEARGCPWKAVCAGDESVAPGTSRLG